MHARVTARPGCSTALLLLTLVLACSPQEESESESVTVPDVGTPTWLDDASKGNEALARHLRGLDVAMVEIDYRYSELYWASEDGNWPYAAYQRDKLRLAMDLALERRPGRAASAESFFDPALEGVREAVEAQDPALFAERFANLTAACNACHAAEQVPSFEVRQPVERRSSIRFTPE